MHKVGYKSMTVARCLEKFKREFAWSYRLSNTLSNTIGYDELKFIGACRHAYKMVTIYISDLSIRQLKNLYQRINYWLDEIKR